MVFVITLYCPNYISIIMVLLLLVYLLTVGGLFGVNKFGEVLEHHAKRTYPGLWDECELCRKLKLGALLVHHPAAMRELAMKVQERMNDDYELQTSLSHGKFSLYALLNMLNTPNIACPCRNASVFDRAQEFEEALQGMGSCFHDTEVDEERANIKGSYPLFYNNQKTIQGGLNVLGTLIGELPLDLTDYAWTMSCHVVSGPRNHVTASMKNNAAEEIKINYGEYEACEQDISDIVRSKKLRCTEAKRSTCRANSTD